MRLLRYGPVGREKSGLLDVQGRPRDLSGRVADIGPEQLSPAGLNVLAAIDPSTLPVVMARSCVDERQAEIPALSANRGASRNETAQRVLSPARQ
jgi:hypothetical protein